jgi:hypothetical protein
MNWRTLNESDLFKSLITLLTVLTAAISAWASCQSVTHSYNIWQEQKQASRPYISLTKPFLTQSPLAFQFEYQNVGVRPAVDLKLDLMIFDQSLQSDSVSHNKTSSANEVSVGTPTIWTISINQASAPIAPVFLVLTLEYYDPIVERNYYQYYFLKWGGLHDGAPELRLSLASLEERDRIMGYFSSHGWVKSTVEDEIR